MRQARELAGWSLETRRNAADAREAFSPVAELLPGPD